MSLWNAALLVVAPKMLPKILLDMHPPEGYLSATSKGVCMRRINHSSMTTAGATGRSVAALRLPRPLGLV